MRRIVMALLFTCLVVPGFAQAPQPYLYRTTLIQAAPGQLLWLIDQLKARAAAEQGVGEGPTWMIRHSQGDHWDLLLLTPIGNYADYFGEKRVEKRQKAFAVPPVRLRDAMAWQEDLFVWGPPMEDVRSVMTSGNFYHVEMFVALPHLQNELRRERQMENLYQKALNRPENLIFMRDMGASWDCYTIGVYRDLKHYAESADIPVEKQEEAARAAGFQSAAHIGPYLRTLIRMHHDTLGGGVK